MDNKNTKDIIALIEKIVERKTREKLSNVETVYDGVIEEVKGTDDSGNETTKLVARVKGEFYDLEATEQNKGVYMRNESGKTLTKGSIIRVYAKGNKLNNSYIGVVFDNNNNDKPIN